MNKPSIFPKIKDFLIHCLGKNKERIIKFNFLEPQITKTILPNKEAQYDICNLGEVGQIIVPGSQSDHEELTI